MLEGQPKTPTNVATLGASYSDITIGWTSFGARLRPNARNAMRGFGTRLVEPDIPLQLENLAMASQWNHMIWPSLAVIWFLGVAPGTFGEKLSQAWCEIRHLLCRLWIPKTTDRKSQEWRWKAWSQAGTHFGFAIFHVLWGILLRSGWWENVLDSDSHQEDHASEKETQMNTDIFVQTACWWEQTGKIPRKFPTGMNCLESLDPRGCACEHRWAPKEKPVNRFHAGNFETLRSTDEAAGKLGMVAWVPGLAGTDCSSFPKQGLPWLSGTNPQKTKICRPCEPKQDRRCDSMLGFPEWFAAFSNRLH